MRAARELAASDAASRLVPDHLYEYEEFTETYSLSRPKVKMLVVNHGGIVVAGACYRVRLDMPVLGDKPSAIPAPLEPIVKWIVPADLLSDVENLARDTQDTWNNSSNIYVQGRNLWNEIWNVELASRSKLEFIDHDPNKPFTNLAEFDDTVKGRCGTRNLLLAEHAAFWSEKTENTDAKKDDEKEQHPASLDLKLEPTAVTIPANAGPKDMPQVTATATVVPPDSECAIEVEYSTGPSDASGLNNPHITTTETNRVYQWTWNVGTNTASGDWPVTVTCTNYKKATVKLNVTGK
jgi:hypothetical protein